MSNDPVERYNQLSAKTRTWLETRRSEDWDAIDDALKMVEKVQTIARFWKWLILSLVGIFVATATLGDSTIKMVGWVRGWLR